MIPKRIEAILACPKCKSSPTIGKTVFCPKCGSSYPIVNDVPIMHVKNKREKIEKEILGTKSAYNLTSFSETISKEKKFLLSSQYNNPDEIRKLPSSVYKMGKKLYPPGPALNRVITEKREPLVDRFKNGLMLNMGSGDNFIHEKFINLDLDLLAGVNVVGNGENLPFLDETFDLIINQAVLEHVKRPKKIVKEMHRVLKRGGYIYIECPFLQEYHAFPLDFQRYTLTGLENLLSDFQRIESGVCAGPSATFGRIFREYCASFSDNPYIHQILKILAGWVIFPIRYLDLYLNKKKYAHVIAMGLYYIGQKAEQGRKERGKCFSS
ncbi:MAG: methyltransferase domain-containing protein [Candidatus Aenigmarchaeota archaeon]|nr:methyltransferase domain-containing protein [Candidatus Aenigmarchaeota archaeon]